MSAKHELHGNDAHGHDSHGHEEKFWLESWWPACVIGVGLVLVVCIDIFNRT